MSSSIPSCNNSNEMDKSSITIDLRPLLEDVSKLMTTHISKMLEGVVGEYTTYKETHDIIMSLPCVKRLQDRVNTLERQLSSSTTSSFQNDYSELNHNPQRCENSDYNETIQLKGAIDELTKYIQHLESCVKSGSTAARQSLDNDIKISECIDNESVRLEIHEQQENDIHHATDETISSEDDDDDSNQVDNRENKIVTIIRADDIPDNIHNNLSSISEQALDADEEALDADEEALDAEEEPEESVDDEEEEDEEEENEEDISDNHETGLISESKEIIEKVDDTNTKSEDDADEEEDELEPEVADDDVNEKESDKEEVNVAEEDEIEVSEVKIKGKTYFTTNPQNGIIYACVDDDVGDEVGIFKNGVAFFNSKK